MNAQKFTQKSLEAIEAAQTIATEHDNMNLDEEHLLLALLEQDGGLIPQLVKRMGLDADRMRDSARRLVESLPGVEAVFARRNGTVAYSSGMGTAIPYTTE